MTVGTPVKTYIMWHSASSYVLWNITPIDMFRVESSECTQPILFITNPAMPNDGLHAKDIEVTKISLQ